jgi:zinc protease
MSSARTSSLALLLLFCLLGVADDAPLSAQPAARDLLPFKATETTLPNGLKVIIVPTGFPNIVSLRIPVQTGSRNEVEPGKTGFAHFFEHVMFRGTPTYPPEKQREIMVKAGARDNASTGDDFTRYFVTFAKEDLETMIRLYADMFQNLAYAEPEFRTEAGAILGEYNKNVANPLAKLDEVQRERAFTTHTYKHTTMGFLKDIEDMPNQYAYSKVFFDRWYRPEFTTVIVAGDVDAGTVLPLIEKYWGPWKKTSAAPKVDIPAEPPPAKALYVHVPWATPTLPLVTVAFRAPAFSDTRKDLAAMEMVASLYFGPTSDLYRKLVVTEQKVDQFFADNPGNVDPALFTIYARVKRAAGAADVRDEILRTVAAARTTPVDAKRLADAKSFARYSFSQSLDSTDRIAGVLASFVPYARSYQTVNNLYRVIDSLTPDDLRKAAETYFTDNSLVVTTLSHEALPEGVATLAPIASYAPPAPAAGAATAAAPALPPLPGTAGTALAGTTVIQQPSALPQLSVKMLFRTGSADDPAGKEGLATLAASMLAEAGSRTLDIAQIEQLLYPMAGSFSAQVDKEMTTFTGSIHRDNWKPFLQIALAQLLDPGYHQADFDRLKAQQRTALIQDLRSDNEEELGKERLQAVLFRGTRYAHPALGTVAGIDAITLDDVKAFVKSRYTRASLMLGTNGDVPAEMNTALAAALATLPEGAAPAVRTVTGRMPSGVEVDIVEKDTRSTAISFGLPIAVRRDHPDFAALSVARVWLGEHRASSGRLFQRIREVRGMNYGDYAYIEAFPRGMYQFFPDPNIARRAQIFEVWIRPVMPANAHMALRVALHEVQSLIDNGLSQADFEQARDYLMKNVYVMTSRQGQQIGYALDSVWYGIPDFVTHVRDALSKLTREQVNAAIRRHLSAANVAVVMITKDAKGLREALVADAPSRVAYDGEKPKALLDEDQVIGRKPLRIAPDKATVTPVSEVFAR